VASRRIEVEIIGDARSLKAALGSSAAGLSTFEKRADRLGRSLTGIGRTMTRNVTLPVAGLGAVATKMALDYDTAMNHVQALTGASAKQTKAWSDQLLNLAPKIGQSPQQLAEALYFVASSGARVNQVLPITAASAKLAAAGMGDAQVVAQLLTSAINAYGPKALSAAKAADVLTEAVKIGKAEPQELADSLGRVIPVAQAMGVTFAEASTSVSELTNTGLNADEAATSIRATLTGLLKPASQTEKAMHKIGLSAAEVRDEIKTKGLNATLQEMAKRVGDNDKLWGQLFPNVRAMTGVLALTGKNADQVSAALDKVEHSTGAASKAFATAQKGPGQQFQRELAQIEATAIRVGNDLLPVVLDVLTTVGNLADSFDHLSENEKHAIEIGLGVAALSGPLLTVGGNVVRLIGLFSKLGRVAGMGGAAGGMAEAGTAAAGAGAGATVAAGAFGALAVIAGGGLLLSLKDLKDKMDDIHNGVDPLTDSTRRFAAGQLKLTGANSQLTQSIEAGGKSVTGWRQIMDQAGVTVHNTSKKLHGEFYWSSGETAKFLRGAMHRSMQNFIGQMRGVAAGAEAASHDTDHFGAAARRQYAHVAALARTTADLAGAINRVPDQKYVSLVLSITTHLQTEGLAPGMGPESTRVGPGGSYKPKPARGPASGTGQGSGANRASGGVIMAGRSYIVGDTAYPETFTSDVPGHIARGGVGHPGVGRVAIVIENWETGTGYMQAMAQGSVARGARKRRQLERMGADA